MKKIILILGFLIALACVVTETAAQKVPLYSPYTLTTDTVTNAGTAYLTIPYPIKGAKKVNCFVDVTKISGTVAGTITIMGSDTSTGTYVALNTEETQTALPTKALTDATNSYQWRLNDSVPPWLRVSITGSGTQAHSFAAHCHIKKQ